MPEEALRTKLSSKCLTASSDRRAVSSDLCAECNRHLVVSLSSGRMPFAAAKRPLNCSALPVNAISLGQARQIFAQERSHSAISLAWKSLAKDSWPSGQNVRSAVSV